MRYETPTEYVSRADQLAQTFSEERRMQRALDPWRHLDYDMIAEDVWEGIPAPQRGDTIAKHDINAVTDTNVALATYKHPKIQVQMQNPNQLNQFNQGNYNERFGRSLFNALDRRRETSLLVESAEDVYHRGKIVIKTLWLTPAERGEERRSPNRTEFRVLTEFNQTRNLTTNGEEIKREGTFPVLVEVIDPITCAYLTNRTTGELVEFVHDTYETWDSLCAMFPDLHEHPDFKDVTNIRTTTGSVVNQSVRVIDYWDQEINSIIIDGRFYKEAEPHHYPWIPFVVQVGRYRKRTDTMHRSYNEAVPFCYPMWKPVRDLSYALSMLNTFMKEIGHVKLVLEGIPTDGSSPWYAQVLNEEGTLEDWEFRLVLDSGPEGRIVPTFAGNGWAEKLRYMEPPSLVQHWERFAQERNMDVEIVSYGRAFLSGMLKAELSGLSAQVQAQLSMARWEPYLHALGRAWGRALERVFALIDLAWESDQRANIPFLIEDVTGQPDFELTRELVSLVKRVDVEIRPHVPHNRAEDNAMWAQFYQLGAMPLPDFMDKTQEVEDPSAAIERMIAYQELMSNPMYRQMVTAKFFRDQGLLGPEQESQATAQIDQMKQQLVQSLMAQQMQQMGGPVGGGLPAEEELPPEEMAIA